MTPRDLMLFIRALCLLGFTLASLPAVAAPSGAEDPAAASTAEGSVAAESTGAAADGETSRRLSPRRRRDGPTARRNRWIYRWAPERNMGEVGVYGGVWFPSRHIELFEPSNLAPDGGFKRYNVVAADIGVRGGYYPFRFFGVELEGGVMPTKLRGSDTRATAWTVRGHVVGQLGLWSITPFILAGTGVLGVSSPAQPGGVGSEQDVIIHFGGGAKFFINRWIMLRLDIRDVVSNRRGVAQGLTSSPEILLGLSITLGRKRKRGESAPAPNPQPNDRDGDTVLDIEDYCPDVYGAPPRGCPQVCIDDNDGDGLINPEDKCPEEPETRNGFEDSDGCPDEVPPELEDLAGVMKGINFDTDKDVIKRESEPEIDNAVEIMKKYPELRVEISGHTDSQGAYRHNMDLSRRRAESVKRHMVSGGIDEGRIQTRGAGPDEPIDSNETADGRAANRRIEFSILDDAGAPISVAAPTEGSG